MHIYIILRAARTASTPYLEAEQNQLVTGFTPCGSRHRRLQGSRVMTPAGDRELLEEVHAGLTARSISSESAIDIRGIVPQLSFVDTPCTASKHLPSFVTKPATKPWWLSGTCAASAISEQREMRQRQACLALMRHVLVSPIPLVKTKPEAEQLLTAWLRCGARK